MVIDDFPENEKSPRKNYKNTRFSLHDSAQTRGCIPNNILTNRTKAHYDNFPWLWWRHAYCLIGIFLFPSKKRRNIFPTFCLGTFSSDLNCNTGNGRLMILSQNALQYFLRRKLLISGFYLSAYPSFSIVNFLKSSRLKKLSPFLLCVYKFFVEVWFNCLFNLNSWATVV